MSRKAEIKGDSEVNIHECINKTVEYLDNLYKDGPHFTGIKSEGEQYAELAKVYASKLDQNIKTLGCAYDAGVQSEVYFSERGWLELPDFPEDRIEIFESFGWKGKEVHNVDGFRFKIGEYKGKWYSGGEGRVGNGTQGFGCRISFHEYHDSREEALSFEIDRMEHYLSGYTEYASSSKLDKELREIEASLHQPTLF